MKTTCIIAFGSRSQQLCRLRCLGLGPGSFRAYTSSAATRSPSGGRRQGRERRHPRHRPVAALCRQPANSGERRSDVARGRALPPGIVPAASAADLAVWLWSGGSGLGGGGAAAAAAAVAAAAVLRAAAVRVAAVGPLVAGRYNEAEPICGRIPKIMNGT